MSMRPEITLLRDYLAEHDKDINEYFKSLCESICFLTEQLDLANIELFALAYGGDGADGEDNGPQETMDNE